MRTALYRHFASDGSLLYVGISNDALRRLLQHKARATWYQQIRRVDVEWLASRELALAAEATAIAGENPAWNVRRPKAPTPVRQSDWFAIRHRGSGRLNGWYRDFDDASEVRRFFETAYPAESFIYVRSSELHGQTCIGRDTLFNQLNEREWLGRAA